MSVAQSIRRSIPPIHKEGVKFIAIFLVVTLVVGFFFPPFLFFGGVLTVWCALFFRDPPRVTPLFEGMLTSPADGTVSAVAPAVPPPELGLGDTPRLRISVFMSVFDGHINRMPIAGRIRTIAYKPGKFLSADLDKASEVNERNGLVIDHASGAEIGVVQIAGLVARRIVCFTQEGAELAQGERFGLIRFGSRVDVYLPAGATAVVAVGMKTVAGETIVADLSGRQAAPPVGIH
jgi:phosphatidylserine decarboxylase